MKALVIAPQPFFSPRGTPFSVYYRTLILSELGIETDLLTYGQGEDVDLPGVRIVRIPPLRMLGAVRTGPSAVKIVHDMLLMIWTIGLLLRRRYDYVHAHEEAVFFCRFLKPIFRFKLVYDMHSSLPQQLDNFEFTKSTLIKSIFSKLERTSLSSADAVITICPDLSDYVISEIGDDPKHLLVENSVFEPVRLTRKPDVSAPPETPPVEVPPNKRVVIYAGTFERYQGLDLLIPAFAIVRQSVPEAVLLMVGGTAAQVQALRDLADEHDLGSSVIFTGRVPQERAKYYNSIAEVLTSPRSSGTNTPLKIYEQLASGKPLVATRIHSHTQVLTDDVAVLVEPTAAGLAQGIIEALSNREAAREKAVAAQQLYQSKYSRPVYEVKMRRLISLLS